MRTQSWRRVQRFVEAVLELPPEGRRGALESETGAGDTTRRRAWSLLMAFDSADSFLQPPSEEDDDDEIDWIGLELGPYRIVEEIGRGGMARVYRARRTDGAFEQEVAVKRMRGGPGNGLEDWFRQERELLGRLAHPSIVRLLDAGSARNGTPFAVMDLVVGDPITTYCDDHQLSLEARLRLFLRVCEAVDHAHRHLIVHRDLKPSNVLVGEGGQPMLLDFGIASALTAGGGSGSGSGRPREWAMTPSYASPEQLAGGPASIGMDVYSLGVVLYELLVGSRPETRGETGGRPWFLTASAPPTASQAWSEVAAGSRCPSFERLSATRRADLDAIVRRALAIDPEERYPSVRSLGDDIERFLQHHPVRARNGGIAYSLRCLVRRQRLIVTAAAAAALLLTTATVSVWQQAEVARRERKRSEAVQQYLVEIFQLADPVQAGGADVTAREILDQTARRITEGEGIAAELEEDVFLALGRAYAGLGLFEQSERFLALGLERLRRARDSDDAEIGRTLVNLSKAWRDQGVAEKAIAFAREAVAAHQGRRQGWVEADLALASALEQAGDLSEAEALARNTLSHLGTEDPKRADALDTLMNVLWARRDIEAALAVATEAAELRRGNPDDPALAVSLTNLGAVRYFRREYKEAEKLQREAMEIQRRIYGPEHPQLTISMNNLANILQQQGSYDQARSIFEECLVRNRKERGNLHPNVVSTLSNLGRLSSELGESAQAETRYREAIALAEEVWPEGHLQLGELENNLGVVLHFEGRYTEALAAYSRAADWISKIGSDTPRGLTILGEARLFGATSLARLHRPEEAEDAFRNALAILVQARGEISVAAASGRNNFADFLLDQGRIEEAWRETTRAAESFAELLPEGHFRRIHAENVRAAVLLQRTAGAEGRDQLEATYRELERKMGPGSHATRLAASRWERARDGGK